MRYLMLMKPGPLAEVPGVLPNKQALVALMKYDGDLKMAGVLLAVESLHDTSQGVRVSKVGGRRQVVDGPFAEAKGLVDRFWLIQVKSKQEAVEWAARCPVDEGQLIELRLVFEMSS